MVFCLIIIIIIIIVVGRCNNRNTVGVFMVISEIINAND